jgi:hypothetical protein
MIAYTIYRGAGRGCLSPDYLIKADKARASVYVKVDAFGFVRDVCGMSGFLHAGVAPEGQAFFILMEAASRDYYE